MESEKFVSITLTLENQKELGTQGHTIAKGKGKIAYELELDENRNVVIKRVITNPDITYIFAGSELGVNSRKYNFKVAQ